MLVQTERGLIYIEGEFHDQDLCREAGFSFAFTVHEAVDPVSRELITADIYKKTERETGSRFVWIIR